METFGILDAQPDKRKDREKSKQRGWAVRGFEP